MKTLIATVMLCVLVVCHSKGQTDERQLYKHKIEAYSKTKNIGSTLLFGGIVASGAGIALMVSAANTINDNPYGNTSGNEAKFTTGSYVFGFGIDMIIGGVILKTVGNRKVKQYQQKLSNLSAGLKISPEANGFALVYRF